MDGASNLGAVEGALPIPAGCGVKGKRWFFECIQKGLFSFCFFRKGVKKTLPFFDLFSVHHRLSEYIQVFFIK